MMDQYGTYRDRTLSLNVCLLLVFMLLLSSCSHVSRQDGPPDFYVDESKIQNPVPKPEPLAKYGNMRSYVVFGKRYYVMPSSKYYSATGTASWYGTKFHSRRTSSGERYDMLGMTAAHKTLPLPTYVYVTNLKNNRTIIVKVNDRGPFEGTRLIDLSYVAAKKLGMLGHGTAHVKVQAIDPYEVAQVKRNSSASMPYLYVQAGAFRNKANASQLKQRLAGLVNHPINIATPTFNSHLYRVRIGPFNSHTEAETITSRLKRLGIHTSVSGV